MDEPFTGLDPVNLVLLREAFLELRDRDRTLIFSTHQMEAAEALCESVAIVDRGRVVAGGTVSGLKRASGRRTVRLGVEGEPAPAWIAEIPGVRSVRPGAGYAELDLDIGVEPASVLATLIARGVAVTHFELADPSLEAIFIEHVGHPADDADGLAESPPARQLTLGDVA
jgi:ABC-2 type transport system ATP-binding protein